MAKSSQSTKGWRIVFTDNNGAEELTLPSGVDEAVYKETKRLTLLLAKRRRLGRALSDPDQAAVDNFYLFVRDKWIAKGLIDGKPSETIPTLGAFLKSYFASRPEKDAKQHQAIWNYLTEYIGENTRIDLITAEKAQGLKNYLMNERPLPKGKRGGCVGISTFNGAIKKIKAAFRYAVDCGYRSDSPFAKVKGGKVVNKKNRKYIDSVCVDEALAAIDNVELRGVLAFARYAGLRIPSEIRHLKFSDFATEPNGDISFVISPFGKTGERVVPLFDELRPYYEALLANRQEGQEYVFAKYRLCTNVGKLIKDVLHKKGVPVWKRFFQNCRCSCITDKLYSGWSTQDLTAVFGNSEDVRQEYYYFGRERSAVAALGRTTNKSATAAPVVRQETPCYGLDYRIWNDPDDPNCVSDYELLEMVVGRGLETEFFPMQFPINDTPFWDSFSDDTPDRDVAILLFERAGWSYEKAVHHVAKYDGLVPFGKRIKSMRSMVYGYKNGKVSAVAFYGYAMYFGGRFLWENVKELWNLADNFDRLFPHPLPPRGIEPLLPD